MMNNSNSHDSIDYDDDEFEAYGDGPRIIRRDPNPGIAAVLSVLIPGLGQIYNGRLIAGLFWFLAAGFGYSAVLVPGFLIHCMSVWCAYRGARYGGHGESRAYARRGGRAYRR